MATHDHTARARLSGRKRLSFNSVSLSNVPLYPLSKARAKQQTFVMNIAGTVQAAETIHKLLDDRKVHHSAGRTRACSQCGQSPLTKEQTNGLLAALHFIRQYVDSLYPKESDSSESG